MYEETSIVRGKNENTEDNERNFQTASEIEYKTFEGCSMVEGRLTSEDVRRKDTWQKWNEEVMSLQVSTFTTSMRSYGAPPTLLTAIVHFRDKRLILQVDNTRRYFDTALPFALFSSTIVRRKRISMLSPSVLERVHLRQFPR